MLWERVLVSWRTVWGLGLGQIYFFIPFQHFTVVYGIWWYLYNKCKSWAVDDISHCYMYDVDWPTVLRVEYAISLLWQVLPCLNTYGQLNNEQIITDNKCPSSTDSYWGTWGPRLVARVVVWSVTFFNYNFLEANSEALSMLPGSSLSFGLDLKCLQTGTEVFLIFTCPITLSSLLTFTIFHSSAACSTSSGGFCSTL